MFSYRSLFKQGWSITWRYKYLWFFGLFASIVASSGAWEYQVFSQSVNYGLIEGSYVRLSGVLETWELAKGFFLGLANLLSYDILTILNVLSIITITLTLIVSFVWLSVTSQAALVIEAKKLLSSKKKSLPVSWRDGFSEGHVYFWRLLGLNILIKFLITIAFFIVALPLLFMALKDTGAMTAAYTILFVIFIPISVSLSLIIKYAIAYVVLNKKPTATSLELGTRLFRRNWLVSLETAILLFIINFAASLAFVLVLAIPLMPLLFFALALDIVWLAYLLIFLTFTAIILFGSIITTFQTTSWTNLFLQLTDKGGQAKLERLFGRYRG